MGGPVIRTSFSCLFVCFFVLVIFACCCHRFMKVRCTHVCDIKGDCKGGEKHQKKKLFVPKQALTLGVVQ